MLARQKLPTARVGPEFWAERFEDIRAFERHLARNGVVVLKFFLHISKEEQRRRLLARLDDPNKHWKFSHGDIAERKLWSKYMAAYEDMIRGTSRPQAPWYVVPADHKWFARLVVAHAITGMLDEPASWRSRRSAVRRARNLRRSAKALLAESRAVTASSFEGAREARVGRAARSFRKGKLYWLTAAMAGRVRQGSCGRRFVFR